MTTTKEMISLRELPYFIHQYCHHHFNGSNIQYMLDRVFEIVSLETFDKNMKRFYAEKDKVDIDDLNDDLYFALPLTSNLSFLPEHVSIAHLAPDEIQNNYQIHGWTFFIVYEQSTHNYHLFEAITEEEMTQFGARKIDYTEFLKYEPESIQYQTAVMRQFWDGSYMVIPGSIENTLSLKNGDKIDIINVDPQFYHDTAFIKAADEEHLMETLSHSAKESLDILNHWVVYDYSYYEIQRDSRALIKHPLTHDYCFVNFDWFDIAKPKVHHHLKPHLQELGAEIKKLKQQRYTVTLANNHKLLKMNKGSLTFLEPQENPHTTFSDGWTFELTQSEIESVDPILMGIAIPVEA